MAIIQQFDLNMIPDSDPVVVHVNQYDTGTGRLVANLYNGDVPYSPVGTAAIQGTKPDGIGFMYSATIDGNTVTANLTDQMSVIAGSVRCQIVVTETSGMTGTFCFDLEVQPSALPDDTSISESDYPIIEEMIRDAQEAAADATIAKADAENAASDSEAWAVGTRGGDPVGPSDPTYQNNSKYYAEHGGGGSGGHVIMDESGNDMPARGTLQFLNMEVTDDPTHLKTVVTGSKGLLPYLYIDSEAGATVTVTAPDSSTITPTAAGSGHWECELGGYGVYVIHSVLDGDDATYSLTVDSVKEYHVTDTHYDYTIYVTAPAGATLRVEGGSETYTGTGTGAAYPFVVHTASQTYTVSATMDGYTESTSVISSGTTGQSTSVTLIAFTALLSLTTASEELFGATVTITKGLTTVGTTYFSAGSGGTASASFAVHETGTFSASCEYQSETYSSEDLVVTTNGQTVSGVINTTIMLTVTLYSATEDTVTFTDAAGSKTEVFATGESSKSVSIVIPFDGMSITFTSSVAKDPTNLSNDYSKSVTITDGTSEVYVMPDGDIYYWFGYEPKTIKGYAYRDSTVSSALAPSVSRDTNKITASMSGAGRGVLGTDPLSYRSLSAYSAFKTFWYTSSATGSLDLYASTNFSTNPYSHDAGTRISQNVAISEGYYSLDISSLSGSYECAVGVAVSGSYSAQLGAMWLE